MKSTSRPVAATREPCPSTAVWSAEESVPIPGKDGMIVRSSRFLDLETPVEFMTSWITPVNHFFVRNHMFRAGQI